MCGVSLYRVLEVALHVTGEPTKEHLLAYVTKDEMSVLAKYGRGTASKGFMGSQGVSCFPTEPPSPTEDESEGGAAPVLPGVSRAPLDAIVLMARAATREELLVARTPMMAALGVGVEAPLGSLPAIDL
jgi:hypothetical protein